MKNIYQIINEFEKYFPYKRISVKPEPTTLMKNHILLKIKYACTKPLIITEELKNDP